MDGTRRTLASASRGGQRLISPGLLVSLVLLLAGLFLPAITVRQYMVFGRDYSLAEGIVAFLESGNYLLFAVVLVFTVIFPVGKVIGALIVWHFVDWRSANARRLMRWLAWASKWSMLDVFIIAITVLVLDGRLLTSADVKAGTLLFAIAVLVSTAMVRRVSMLAERT